MFDADRWQEIFSTMARNKLRTFMTACGVFWGIFMLIMMLGFGNGLENGIRTNMAGYAYNSVYVWGQRTGTAHKGLPPGRNIQFDTEDIDVLKDLPGLEHLAPRGSLGGWRGGANVVRGKETGDFRVSADYPAIQFIQPMAMKAGRFLNPIDIRDKRKVAVIGKHVREVLFQPNEDPIGKYIKIKGVYFLVVGVFNARQTGDNGERQEQTVHIPFTTFQQAFNITYLGWFAMTAQPGYSALKLEQDVRSRLQERHKIHPDDTEALGSFNASERFGNVLFLFTGINALTWFVGVLTLLAGVLGVSNIMLIVVKERTKEIGIRRAIGAPPGSVVRLVLQESIFLTAFAGYLGMCAAVLVLELARKLVGDGSQAFANPGVDFNICMAATVLLVVAGAVAGIIPARHAAKISPVVALRAD